ncbi:Protein transport protein-like, partial [Capsicum baccatum]
MSQSKLGILCKLDIEKAYDQVNWDFILRQIGFGERWIGWIKFCMSTVKFSVLINGSPGGFFNAHRGIRQGDPLSPFLFIIAMEGLNNMLNIAKEAGRIQGFEVSKVAGNSVEITHLQYADDTLIFFGAEEEQLMILRLILVYFEAISGLHINWSKSHLYPINVVPEMDHLSRILGGVVGNLPSVYLGMPLGAKSRTQFWRTNEAVLTLDNVAKRGISLCNRCSLCGKDTETVRPFPALQIHCPALADFPKSQRHFLVVDFGESGPVRCSRCKGYINPFMKFIDQGRRFICNFCGHTDETPRDYQCNLGPDGRRRDADERPELCRGTVEFVATKEYMVRDPMPAVYFFLIDVSMNAIQTGATAAACSAISQVISDLPDGPRTLVGVATFDSTIHFYNLKRALQQPLMLIVPDVQDVYTPLQTDVIVQLSECRQHLELLLESIPTMFQNNRTADSAFGAAVKAAFLAIKSTGGKLLVFQSVLPSTGIGALSAREAEGRTNVSAAEKEANKLLQPADKNLKTMAIEFAEYQVCVDVFLTTQSYVDIASISVIPRTTGGQVYYYFPFSAVADTAKLYNDLRWNITRPEGFEAVMRVRCSQGIQVQEYSGNYCKRIPTDVDLPAIDCDKTIMVTLKHDDKLQEGSECSFQSAVLYTTIDGQRRIRVSTLALPCTTMLSNLFRSADLDTQFACILKQAASEVPTAPLSRIREQVTNLCINILHSYRKYCATVSSSGQLILPEALKLLPLYTLALVKSTGLRTDGQIDSRSFWINYVSPLSTPLAIPLVYPRLIAIHELDTMEDGDSLIPHSMPLSSEHISDTGIYLLENGEDCLIYVGNSADPNVIHQLLGISSVEEIPAQFVLQQQDNPLSKKLNDIINDIRRQRCNYLRLKLCKKGDSS